ncbi:MAG: hypothetical protein HKN92_05790 [Chitinophagales bacterium]|nr:hypothetical protein [Chitinophagales bacterium]
MSKHLTKGMIIVVMIAMFQITAEAQQISMIGARVGYPFGVTFRLPFNNKANAIFEGIVGTRGNSISFTALFEGITNPAQRSEFEFFYGGGAHLGFYGTRSPYWDTEPDPFFGLGIDGIVGVGWNFTNVPVNLTFDYKPAVNFIGPGSFWYGDAAVSVRYVFR